MDGRWISRGRHITDRAQLSERPVKMRHFGKLADSNVPFAGGCRHALDNGPAPDFSAHRRLFCRNAMGLPGVSGHGDGCCCEEGKEREVLRGRLLGQRKGALPVRSRALRAK